MGLSRWIVRSRIWAGVLKRDAMTLWFARRHPHTPWYAKVMAVAVLLYALSPIDLIPDFIPVLGYLDDVILLPVLIWLTLRALPERVRTESRAEAETWLAGRGQRPRWWVGAVLIGLLWVGVLAILIHWVMA